jgi:hypothetical protein
VGVAFAVICGVLGGLQFNVARRRRSHEFALVQAAGVTANGMVALEFAGTALRLSDIVEGAGERGRRALLRCLDLDYLMTAGYLFVGMGVAGFLAAVHRSTLGVRVLEAVLVAAAFGVIENTALRHGVSGHPETGPAAPMAAIAAGLKWLALVLGAVAVVLWPWRTLVG